MGVSLLYAGDIREGQAHYNRAMALYDPAERNLLATTFGVDTGVLILSRRSWTPWLLGYPQAARADVEHALRDAHENGHVATLMYALAFPSLTLIWCGNNASTNAQLDELVALADKKGALLWKAAAILYQGCVAALTGKAPDAVQKISSGLTAWRSTGATVLAPFYLSCLAGAYGGTRPIRGRLALHSRSNDCDANDQGGLV
jgi:hypothetical protein